MHLFGLEPSLVLELCRWEISFFFFTHHLLGGKESAWCVKIVSAKLQDKTFTIICKLCYCAISVVCMVSGLKWMVVVCDAC